MNIATKTLWFALLMTLLGFGVGAYAPLPAAANLAGVGVLAIAAAALFARHLMQPLSELSAWLQRIGQTPQADFQAASLPALPQASADRTLGRRDEIGALARQLVGVRTQILDSLQHLKQTAAAKERMETELEIGRSIQMDLLSLGPATFPNHPDLAIFAVLQPAREVGGDFYDSYFVREQLSYLLREHCYQVCFCIGDTSGKGVPAALFTTVMKTMIKAQTYVDASPAKAVTRVNQVVSENNPSMMFTTLFLGILNLVNGELTYTLAGHDPPYLIQADGTISQLEGRHGPAVGVSPEAQYRESKIRCKTGDLLVTFTDGVTEAMDPEGNLFSEQRFHELLQSARGQSPEAVIQLTTQKLRQFQGDGEQADDITLLSFQYLGNPIGEDEYSEFSLIQAAISQLKKDTRTDSGAAS